MDPSLTISPDAYWRAQRQSRAEIHKAYRAENPRAPVAVFLTVGLFLGAMAYATTKLNARDDA